MQGVAAILILIPWLMLHYIFCLWNSQACQCYILLIHDCTKHPLAHAEFQQFNTHMLLPLDWPPSPFAGFRMRENWNGVPGQVRPPAAAAAAGMPAHLQAVLNQVILGLIFRDLMQV